MYLRFERKRKLGVAAADRAREIHAISRLHTCDAFAHRLHHSRSVAAWRVWQRRLHRISSGAHIGIVAGLTPRSLHAHQNLSRARPWRGNLDDLHYFRRAELVHLNRFHGLLPLHVANGYLAVRFSTRGIVAKARGANEGRLNAQELLAGTISSDFRKMRSGTHRTALTNSSALVI